MSKVLSVVIVLLLLGLGAIGVMYFAKSDKGGMNYSSNESTPSSTTATSPADTSSEALDADIGNVQLEDPTGDLKGVNADIETL